MLLDVPSSGPTIYHHQLDSTCYMFVAQNLNHLNASSSCQQPNMGLLSIPTQQIQTFVIDKIQQHHAG